MNAVDGFHVAPGFGNFGVGGIKQIDHAAAPLLGELLHRVGVWFQILVVFLPRRKRPGQVLMGDGSQQDEAHFVAGIGLDAVEQAGQIALERGRSGGAVERGRHPVAHEDHGRVRDRHLVGQLAKPDVRRLIPVEARARFAVRQVRAPAQVAKDNLAVGILDRHQRFHVAQAALPLHESVAEKEDAIAILEVEGVHRGRQLGQLLEGLGEHVLFLNFLLTQRGRSGNEQTQVQQVFHKIFEMEKDNDRRKSRKSKHEKAAGRCRAHSALDAFTAWPTASENSAPSPDRDGPYPRAVPFLCR